MRILISFLILLAALPASAADLRYKTVIRIASNGETVDFSRYQHVRPILQLSHRGSRNLPTDSQVAIDASAGAIVLRPDPLGSIEWPMLPHLAAENPKVTSVPDDLVAAGLIRVTAPPATTIAPSTVAAMADEYRRFTRELSFLKRIAAPSPRGLLIVSKGPITATSSAGTWQSTTGRLRVPLDAATSAPITLSTPPSLVLLDLDLE